MAGYGHDGPVGVGMLDIMHCDLCNVQEQGFACE